MAQREASGKTITDMMEAIGSAGNYLRLAAAASYVTETADRLRAHQHALEDVAARISGAAGTAGQGPSPEAAKEAKDQAQRLGAIKDQMKGLDAAAASEVEGYVEQAVTFIEQAQLLARELP